MEYKFGTIFPLDELISKSNKRLNELLKPKTEEEEVRKVMLNVYRRNARPFMYEAVAPELEKGNLKPFYQMIKEHPIWLSEEWVIDILCKWRNEFIEALKLDDEEKDKEKKIKELKKRFRRIGGSLWPNPKKILDGLSGDIIDKLYRDYKDKMNLYRRIKRSLKRRCKNPKKIPPSLVKSLSFEYEVPEDEILKSQKKSPYKLALEIIAKDHHKSGETIRGYFKRIME
ncbi:hypothetical protein ISS37_04830 [candidate division KSB1 bacterium]|nr:hypothetical protein [candidate division KSB1 bacterium]